MPLIIGMGTGRCGTVSLSKILNNQKDSLFTHEFTSKPVDWSGPSPLPEMFVPHILSGKSFVGDVSSVHLSFVDDYIQNGTDTKFIILKRNREEVIQSFMKKTKDRNHWMEHDGSKWRKNKWDKMFPKFKSNSKEEAIGKYYDYYYNECLKIPSSIKYLMNMEDLNDESKVLDMLRWCGFPEPKFKKFHSNKGR